MPQKSLDLADVEAVFGYVCEVCARYRVSPLEMWERGTLEQLFIMAESGKKVRREELRELVYVAHGEPKAFLESLKDREESNSGMLALAAHVGDQNAVKRMKRNAMARRFMSQAKEK